MKKARSEQDNNNNNNNKSNNVIELGIALLILDHGTRRG
jgi:hypothetical protein